MWFFLFRPMRSKSHQPRSSYFGNVLSFLFVESESVFPRPTNQPTLQSFSSWLVVSSCFNLLFFLGFLIVEILGAIFVQPLRWGPTFLSAPPPHHATSGSLESEAGPFWGHGVQGRPTWRDVPLTEVIGSMVIGICGSPNSDLRIFDAWNKFQTYSPKWWWITLMNPKGSKSAKNHPKKQIQAMGNWFYGFTSPLSIELWSIELLQAYSPLWLFSSQVPENRSNWFSRSYLLGLENPLPSSKVSGLPLGCPRINGSDQRVVSYNRAVTYV